MNINNREAPYTPQKEHKIRSKSGELVRVGHYTRSKAIKAFCTECMGFETHPKNCSDTSCPLHPFRGKLGDTVRRRAGQERANSNE